MKCVVLTYSPGRGLSVAEDEGRSTFLVPTNSNDSTYVIIFCYDTYFIPLYLNDSINKSEL